MIIIELSKCVLQMSPSIHSGPEFSSQAVVYLARPPPEAQPETVSEQFICPKSMRKGAGRKESQSEYTVSSCCYGTQGSFPVGPCGNSGE